jgi:uncharacterized membrane protein
MKSIMRRFKRLFHVFLLLGGIAGALPAQAASYVITTIDYPGAKHTAFFGISNKGQVVGNAYADDTFFPTISFVYDSKKNLFTPLPNVPGSDTKAFGINNRGNVVGYAFDGITLSGTILDKGAFTIFSHPGLSSTLARAISTSGLVTGIAIDDTTGSSFGFIYDPKRGSFTDFLPNLSAFATGINDRGEVVGSVSLDPDQAYPGSPYGDYGFLRRKSGAITLFRVNDHFTRARGISNSGQITGVVSDGSKWKGFVATLATRGGFQSLTIPVGDLLEIPGAKSIFALGINDSGHISGNWIDDTGAGHGFIATRTK